MYAIRSYYGKGDEVLTSGGLVGRIAKVAADSDYLVLALNRITSYNVCYTKLLRADEAEVTHPAQQQVDAAQRGFRPGTGQRNNFV